jgi:RimJ/RimL family protein N-acetyltransferase
MSLTYLETERLKLRQWTEENSEGYAEFYSDEVNAKYVGGKKDKDEAWRNLAMLVGHWQLKNFGYFAVEEKQSNTFVGCVGLWKSPGWPELELGYWLTKEAQGKGFAAEAGACCIVYTKEVLKAKSLVSYIAPENEASKRVAQKLGATYESTIELLSHGKHCIYRYF